VNVDLDCPEAVAAAEYLMPPTGWVAGRGGNPSSHRFSISHGVAFREFSDPDPAGEPDRPHGAGILELRGTGHQTILPPSLHPDGDRYAWERFTDPAEMPSADLGRAAARTAAAALFARHWPTKGARHTAHRRLAGGLLRNGFPLDDAIRFLEAVTCAAGNTDFADCRGAVNTTQTKLEKEGKSTDSPSSPSCSPATGGPWSAEPASGWGWSRGRPTTGNSSTRGRRLGRGDRL
jgi:hypothetical protein